MQASTWSDVATCVKWAQRHFSHAVDVYDRPITADIELLKDHAFMQLMQSGFNAVEAAIKHIYTITGEQVPAGKDGTRSLIDQASGSVPGLRKNLFSASLVTDLHTARKFRHVVRYGFHKFDLAGALKVRDVGMRLANDFAQEILTFVASHDPDLVGSVEALLADEETPVLAMAQHLPKARVTPR